MADRRDTMFNILLTPDAGGGLVVTCPELPEVITQGATRPEALENAADALAEAVAGRMRRGEDIPASGASIGADVESVALPESTGPKMVLYLAMQEAGIGKSELARRVGCDEKQIRRLLDLGYATNIEAIGDALRARGRQLNLRFDQGCLTNEAWRHGPDALNACLIL